MFVFQERSKYCQRRFNRESRRTYRVCNIYNNTSQNLKQFSRVRRIKLQFAFTQGARNTSRGNSSSSAGERSIHKYIVFSMKFFFKKMYRKFRNK